MIVYTLENFTIKHFVLILNTLLSVSFLIHYHMKKITSLFYVNSNGKKPVREWLLSLDKADRKIIGEDIKTIEYGFPIGMPTCRKLGSKLYEVRSNISDKKISRVILLSCQDI